MEGLIQPRRQDTVLPRAEDHVDDRDPPSWFLAPNPTDDVRVDLASCARGDSLDRVDDRHVAGGVVQADAVRKIVRCHRDRSRIPDERHR
jgi:hypothetical protein